MVLEVRNCIHSSVFESIASSHMSVGSQLSPEIVAPFDIRLNVNKRGNTSASQEAELAPSRQSNRNISIARDAIQGLAPCEMKDHARSTHESQVLFCDKDVNVVLEEIAVAFIDPLPAEICWIVERDSGLT